MRRDPHNHLQDVFLTAAKLMKIERTRWHDLGLHADPLSASAYDQSSRSGISDPTPQQAANLVWAHELQDEILALSAEAAGIMRQLEQRFNRVPTFMEAKQFCTGGSGLPGAPEWGAAKCDSIPAYTHGHNAGLCANHVRYRNRWESKRREGAA
jgi:hypothetical protein